MAEAAAIPGLIPVVLDGPKAQVLQKLQTPPGASSNTPNTRAA